MPLKLWLPLNGTTENRGTSEIGMLGSPFAWGAGKTGAKSATFSNNASAVIYEPSNTSSTLHFTTQDFSWAVWITKNYANKTANAMYAFTVGRVDSSGYGYGLQVASKTGVNLWFGSSAWGIPKVNDDEWHHIAFARSGTNIRIWRDGSLVVNTTFTGSAPSYLNGNGLGIGCFHYTGGNIYPLIGSVQDLRIYDHALSDKEVVELSRGLMLHFPLYAPGDANPNLLTWSKDYTKNTPYVHTSAGTDGYAYMGNDSLVSVTPNRTYYVQLRCDHMPKASHGSTGAVCDQFTFWFYERVIGTSKAVGGFDRAICFTSSNIYYSDTVNGLYVWKWTAHGDAQDVTLRTNSYSDGSTAVTLKFWDIKIEADSYTAYVPPANAAQYAALAMGSVVVRDTSGMGNDGTRYGSPTFAGGTPRYSTGTVFSAGKGIWPIPDPITSSTTEFTMSVWFSVNDTNGNKCIWTGRGTYAFAVFVISSGIRVDDSHESMSPYQIVSANTWYHLAVTWKKGGDKVAYLNGTQVLSVYAGTLSKTNTKASIGIRSLADALQSSESDFKGKMSDFRFYATAFSADQVKALYNAPVSIARTGDCHAVEFHENVAGSSVNRAGVVSCGGISSLPGKYDSHVLIERDGSCWAHIVHHADPTTYKFASGDTFATGVWKDARRFFDASLCDSVDKWEFLLVQKADASSSTCRYRWVQGKNPNTAAFADVAASAVTKKGAADGYTAIESSYGGIYKFNSATYYCANNGNNGNWWGAIGAWGAHQGGIPGYNAVVVKDGGYQDLYIRIDNVTFSSKRDRCSVDKAGKSVLSPDFTEQ
jgi:hypothetical protein